MKNRFIPAVAGLAFVLLSASSARAQFGFNCTYHASGSFGFSISPSCGGCGPACSGGGGGGGYGGAQLGPWYNYWPLDAHFQTPALPQYPYWPAPQGYYQGAAQAPAQQTGYGPGYQPGYQSYPVPSTANAGQSYYNPYRTASYPAYWYGR